MRFCIVKLPLTLPTFLYPKNNVLTQAISDDIATQLEADREVAYTVISTDDVAVSGRVVTGKGDAEVKAVTAAEVDEGVTADDRGDEDKPADK